MESREERGGRKRGRRETETQAKEEGERRRKKKRRKSRGKKSRARKKERDKKNRKEKEIKGETVLSFTRRCYCDSLPHHPHMLACQHSPSTPGVMPLPYTHKYIRELTVFLKLASFGSKVANYQRGFNRGSGYFPSRKCAKSPVCNYCDDTARVIFSQILFWF